MLEIGCLFDLFVPSCSRPPPPLLPSSGHGLATAGQQHHACSFLAATLRSTSCLKCVCDEHTVPLSIPTVVEMQALHGAVSCGKQAARKARPLSRLSPAEQPAFIYC